MIYNYLKKKAWYKIMRLAGAGGPYCPCCRYINKKDLKKMSNKTFRNTRIDED
jgi:hypothetical protein